MNKSLHKLEVSHKKQSPILLYCLDEEIMSFIGKHYAANFQVVYIAKNALESLADTNATFVPPSSLNLLERVKESPEYAVIFLNTTSDKHVLERVLKAFPNSNTRYLILFPITEYSRFVQTVKEYADNQGITFAAFGQLFSNKRRFSNELTAFLNSTLTTKKYVLSGDDLTPIFPVSDEDLLIGISSLLFSNSHNRLHFLFYKHPQTQLSAIHVLKRIEPDLHAQISEEKPRPSTLSREEIEKSIVKELGYSPEYREEHMLGFEKTLLHYNHFPNGEKTEQTTKVLQKAKGKKVRTKILFTSLGAIVLILLLICISTFVLVKQMASNASRQLEEGDLISLSKTLSRTQFFLSVVKPVARSVEPVTSALGFDNDIFQTLSHVEDGAQVGSILEQDARVLASLNEGLDQKSLDSMLADWVFAYFELERLQTATQLPVSLNSDYAKILSLSPTFRDILGYGEKKEYLLLFQNNRELRPTGGFIGSVGELVVENGKVTSILISDVYELDGQLKTHIEPHYIVKRYLQPHMYLRDSNFDLSFEESAKNAAQIYKLETGKEVDGVIALDFDVLVSLIEGTGPIQLPTFNTTLTQENAFDFMQEKIDTNFFAGSTDKRDLLNEIFNEMTKKLQENPNLSFSVGRKIPQLILEGSILFSFPDETIQKSYRTNGFSQSFFDYRNKQTGAFYDTLSVNEANIGANKANQFVRRSLTYEADIRGDQTTSELTILLDNSMSVNESYLSYIRILVPFKSVLDSITIDGQSQEITEAVTDPEILDQEDFTPPASFEVSSEFIYGYQIFGFVTEVAPQKIQTIKISYTNGMTGAKSGDIKYSLLYFKQPGIAELPMSATVYFPEEYKPEDSNARVFGNNFITIDKTFTQTGEIAVHLNKEVK